MVRPVTGARSRIDVIANQNTSAGNEQAVKLSIKLWDAAGVTELVHRLQSAGLREIEVTSFVSP